MSEIEIVSTMPGEAEAPVGVPYTELPVMVPGHAVTALTKLGKRSDGVLGNVPALECECGTAYAGHPEMIHTAMVDHMRDAQLEDLQRRVAELEAVARGE